jgi:hypothetical protein
VKVRQVWKKVVAHKKAKQHPVVKQPLKIILKGQGVLKERAKGEM